MENLIVLDVRLGVGTTFEKFFVILCCVQDDVLDRIRLTKESFDVEALEANLICSQHTTVVTTVHLAHVIMTCLDVNYEQIFLKRGFIIQHFIQH